MQGFIKLHRQITEWEWYSNINVCRLFIHCLLKANHKDNKWQGIVIERGSFITSIENLAFETGLSGQQIRTALNKLKSTGEITSKTTNRYSIISIKNWNSYQLDNTQDNKQITNKQQTNNKQITTNNNDNNDNNVKNDNKHLKKEIEDYCKIVAKKIDIDSFMEYYNACNWQDKNGMPINWKQKVIAWSMKQKEEQKQEEPKNFYRVVR